MSLQLAPPGLGDQLQCTCPAFAKINGHCKHVAALLIALRDQVRPPKPQPAQPQAPMAALPAVTAGPTG